MSAPATTRVDPITASVIAGALESIAVEMGHKLARMSYSSIIRESEDFGCVICDAQARQLAESSQSTPLQSGPLPGGTCSSTGYSVVNQPTVRDRSRSAKISSRPWPSRSNSTAGPPGPAWLKRSRRRHPLAVIDDLPGSYDSSLLKPEAPCFQC